MKIVYFVYELLAFKYRIHSKDIQNSFFKMAIVRKISINISLQIWLKPEYLQILNYYWKVKL